MKNNLVGQTARVLGLTSAILVGAGSWLIGWSQSPPGNWEWEAAKRVFIEENMYSEQAACQSLEDQRLQRKSFDLATKNFQHALHLHGLKERRFETMKTAFLKKERDYLDIFEKLTTAERASRDAVNLHRIWGHCLT